MKVSINIECESIEECCEISKAIELFKNKKLGFIREETEPEKARLMKVASAAQERFIPLTKWEEYYPWPKTAALRNLVFFERTNGFHKCIKRVGRRVLIDEKAFFEWIREQK